MLRNSLTVVVWRCPFTIRLTDEPKTYVVQRVTLGIAPGYGTVGFPARTAGRELMCEEVVFLINGSNIQL